MRDAVDIVGSLFDRNSVANLDQSVESCTNYDAYAGCLVSVLANANYKTIDGDDYRHK